MNSNQYNYFENILSKNNTLQRGECIQIVIKPLYCLTITCSTTMSEKEDQINLLMKKLDEVLNQQESFKSEINSLKQEIRTLKSENPKATTETKVATPPTNETSTQSVVPVQKTSKPQPKPIKKPKIKKGKSDLEKFIGENLINKIGIGITIIGVGIGAKYAIDHDMVSPLTRIILGYLVGLGLLGFAFKLKAKYENFSAVLLSGAMAILYFITYTAYSFYEMFPQLMAFALMVIFTGFTVAAAINYNRVVIANIGLVGAYAVPFLLSDGSGQVQMLFSYMTVINGGILILALKKYWKSLYYSSFGFTWIIYLGWLSTQFEIDQHQNIALIFASIFYIVFYTSFVAYKFINNQKFTGATVWLLLANSFIFYGIGYYVISEIENGEELLGLFTLANAVVHFIVGVLVQKQKLADKSLLYLVIGLVLTFLTLAIPVQLDGNWVTILWSLEALLLFSIGRIKSLATYEKLSYPLMLVAFFSLLHDWGMQINYYDPLDAATRLTPLFNIQFLTSLIVSTALGVITYIKFSNKWEAPDVGTAIKNISSFVVPTLFLIALFGTFQNEIGVYWDQEIEDSMMVQIDDTFENSFNRNWDLEEFKTIWTVNYFLLFISALALFNWKRTKSKGFGTVILILGGCGILTFLTGGLYSISELRESFNDSEVFFPTGPMHIGIRYISLLVLAFSIWAMRKHTSQEVLKSNLTLLNDLILYITVLWVASSELIHWLDMAGFADSYKLGLSILWGFYSLALISIGIWKKQKHIRIIAMAWFGITLIKLFAYDLSDLSNIRKTIVLVSLGIILLITSFLYNKYKEKISSEEGDK